MGRLTNAKPSAIFRLRGTFIPSSAASTSSFGTSGNSSTATLGISCEPLPAVEAQLAALGQTGAGAAANPALATALVPAKPAGPDPVQLAALVGKNLFNAVGSFAQPLPNGQGSWIEFSLVERWYRCAPFPPPPPSGSRVTDPRGTTATEQGV